MRRFAAGGLLLVFSLSVGPAFAEPVLHGRPVSSWAGLLRHSHPTERRQAAEALAQLGPAAEPAVPALIGALADPEPEVRQAAQAALGRVGPAAVDPLRKELTRKEVPVRLGAAVALGLLGR